MHFFCLNFIELNSEMKIPEEPIKYNVFPIEESDKRFENILLKAKSGMPPEEISKIMHKELFNRAMIAKPFERGSESLKLYRITPEFEGFDKNNLDHYSFPPREKTNEGRANVKGHPVLYCAFDETTALLEMKQQLVTGAKFYLSCWEMEFSRDVIAHTLFYNSKSLNVDGIIAEIAENEKKQLIQIAGELAPDACEGFLHSVKKMNDLFCSSGDENYHITSAYAHEILYGNKIQEEGINVSFIMYPSLVNGESGLNFAIHPDFVREMMTLKSVTEVTFTNKDDDNLGVIVHKKGDVVGDAIEWKGLRYAVKKSYAEGFKLVTCKQGVLTDQYVLDLKINDSEKTVRDLLNGALKEFVDTQLPKEHAKMNVDLLRLDEGVYTGKIMISFDCGNRIKTEQGEACVREIHLKIDWGYRFEKLLDGMTFERLDAINN